MCSTRDTGLKVLMSNTCKGVLADPSGSRGTGRPGERPVTGTADRCTQRVGQGSLRTRVAVVLSGWPRVSEVFALNELVALHRAGLLAAVLATKAGESGPVHPAAAEIDPLVEVLPAGDVATQAAVAAERV